MKALKTLILFVFLHLLLNNSSNAQCVISSSSSVNGIPNAIHDTVKICIGQTVDLYSQGSCGYLMDNNFNNSTIGAGWSSNVTASFTNPCPPNLLPAQSVVLWFGANAYPRSLVTVGYDMSWGGCRIEWDMKYGKNQNTANCESPDEPTEGVHLQWSINNGTTWTQFAGTDLAPSGTYGTGGYVNGSGGYWTPVAGNAATGPYYDWNHYKTVIPSTANTANTKIRWYQDIASGNGFDHWGIDNVQIVCNAPSNNITWSTGGNVIANAFNTQVSPTQSAWYVVTIKDDTTNYQASDSIYIKVFPVPTSDFTVVSPICSNYGSTINFSGTASSSAVYNWTFGGDVSVTIGTGSGPYNIKWDNPSANLFDSTVNIVSLVVVDKNNCTSTQTDKSVTVFASPNINYDILPNNPKGCAPVDVSFNNTSEPGNCVKTVLWYFGDGTTSNNSSVNHTYTVPGLYDVKLFFETNYGCKDSAINTNAVEVYSQPVASFTVNPTLASRNNAHFVFNNLTTGASNFNWEFGDGTNSILINPTHDYFTTGNFVIWLYASTIHNCFDSTSLTVKVVEDSLIFPNIITPNGDGHNDYFDVTNLSPESYPHCVLYIFNRWGKKVYEKENYYPVVDKWDGKGLADGTYFYVLSYEGYLRKGEYKGSITILR